MFNGFWILSKLQSLQLYTSAEKGVGLTFIGVGLFVLLFDCLCDALDKKYFHLKTHQTNGRTPISHFEKQNDRLLFE